MKPIALLVNSEAMLPQVKAAIEHAGAENDIEIIMTHAYAESLRLCREFKKNGGRLVIARGGHARILLESNIDIPITTIPFTGNNIASLLVRATNDWGRFAVVGNSTMIQMTRELERPIGASIQYYEIRRWADFDELMQQIRAEGLKAVIGGYDTASAARTHGLHDYCLETSEYEILTAIMEAKSLLSAMERDKYWRDVFEVALDAIGEGIVVTGNNGEIVHSNRRAVKLIGTNGSISVPLFPGLQQLIDKVREDGRPIYDELLEYGEYKLAASLSPVSGPADRVVISLREVEYVHKIARNIRQKLANKGLVAKNTFDSLCVESPRVKNAVDIAKQYALTNSSVLIYGETGTGKEMFAQSIHNYSMRRDEAFVAVNCATIPTNLLESELFGYVEGAFTGAKRGGKIGLFELAHQGTIFLDEIGETSLDMQARLLRVLEEHEIMRVGDDKVIPVDIRVIAASNRDLRKLVEEGSFRSDFYYRLDVLSLHLPPLRQSLENLEPMIRSFTERIADENKKVSPKYTPEALSILSTYPWPGNVRELKNIVERLVVTNNMGLVDAPQVREALHMEEEEGSASEPMGMIDEAEYALIRQVLEECGGNKTAAAKKLGISRPTLHRRLRLMGEGGRA